MVTREYSITRSRAAFKPRVSEEEIPFFSTEHGDLLLGVSGDQPLCFTGSGRTAVAHLPFEAIEPTAVTQAPVHSVELINADEAPESIHIDYRIDGGFNNNCIIVTWEVDNEAYSIEWVCLKTFTGMQIKYVNPTKRARLVFALADEDAFAYCDKEPCEECGFRCKSGFSLYAFVRGFGIVSMPLERISTLELLRKK